MLPQDCLMEDWQTTKLYVTSKKRRVFPSQKKRTAEESIPHGETSGGIRMVTLSEAAPFRLKSVCASLNTV